MKRWITIVSVGILIGTASAVPAQSQHSSSQMASELTSVRSPLTPARRARYHKAALLSRAATEAMRLGDYAEAEANARACLAAEAGFDAGFAEEVLAAALDAQGKTQEALQAYKVIADEGDFFPRNLLPYALLSLKAGNWSQAVSAYNKALPLLDNGDLVRKNSQFSLGIPHPTALMAAIHTALGLQLDWRGYHGAYQKVIQQSLTHFQKAAALEPSSPTANYYVGYGLKRLGRQAEAQVAFTKAAMLDQGDIKAAAMKELPAAK